MSDLIAVLSDLMPYIMAIISGAVGWLSKSYRADRAKDRAMENGLRTLLRAELLEIHTLHVVRHEPISVSVQDEAERAYRAYHDLGGNGVGTMLWKQIMDLHAYVDDAASKSRELL